MPTETNPGKALTKRRSLPKERAGETDVLIGQRIRARRKELHLPQQKLATAIGVTFQQIQKYERGRNRVSASTLSQIAQALRIDIRYFYQRPQTPAPLIPPSPEPEPKDLLALFQRIGNPEHRRQLLEFAQTFAEFLNDGE